MENDKMLEISKEKEVTEKDLSRAKYYVLADEAIVWLILSWFVVLGIETYYRNITGEPGVTYITGPFTWIFGIAIFQLFARRVKIMKNGMRYIIKNNEGKITTRYCIDDNGITKEREGIGLVFYNWDCLVRHEVNKKGTAVYLLFAATEVTLTKDDIGDEGIQLIKSKLK